jgi:hypothetical protein
MENLRSPGGRAGTDPAAPFARHTYIACIIEVVESSLGFDWDEGNVAHIARYGVAPDEVEQVFVNEALDLGFELVNGEERWTSIGHTAALRVLVIVWTMRGERVRTVTAFEAGKRAAEEYVGGKGR